MCGGGQSWCRWVQSVCSKKCTCCMWFFFQILKGLHNYSCTSIAMPGCVFAFILMVSVSMLCMYTACVSFCLFNRVSFCILLSYSLQKEKTRIFPIEAARPFDKCADAPAFILSNITSRAPRHGKNSWFRCRPFFDKTIFVIFALFIV